MKINMKNTAVKTEMISAILTAVAFVAFAIYGLVYSVYADYTVMLFLILAAAAYVFAAVLDNPLAEILPLAAVICGALALNIVFLNSYTVWADWYGHFNMYGSQGGVTPVIIILALILLSVICGIAACFMRKNKEVQ